MREEYCEACETLETSAPTFVNDGVTNGISNRLKEDNGFGPGTKVDTDCEALNLANDCLIGGMGDELEKYDVCDIKTWIKLAWENLYTVLKAMIAAICGLWDKVHCILSGLKILLQQLTDTSQTSSFAAETHYAIALGTGNGAHIPIYKQQVIIPKVTDTLAQATDYAANTTVVDEVLTAQAGFPYIRSTVTGPSYLDEVTYPSDGVAIVGCCLYTSNTEVGKHIAVQVSFYTDKDTASLSFINTSRGMHYGFNPTTGMASGRAQSYTFSSAIKVKAGSHLRIFVHPDDDAYPRNGNNEIDVPTGDPAHDADLTYPYGDEATTTVHQIYSTFIPDFASALSMNVDPHLFDNCGD